MSGEFSLAGGGAEHVEDRLERFRTECHWRPQYTATRYVISCCKYTPLVNLCTTVKTRAPTTARTFRSESCERAFNCTDPPGTRTTSILGWSRVIVSKMFCSLTYHTGIWRVMLLEKKQPQFPSVFQTSGEKTTKHEHSARHSVCNNRIWVHCRMLPPDEYFSPDCPIFIIGLSFCSSIKLLM